MFMGGKSNDRVLSILGKSSHIPNIEKQIYYIINGRQ